MHTSSLDSLNPSYTFFNKQNKLLVSWLISTISGDLLLAFTGATTVHQIWNKAARLFAMASDVKLARLKHDLHSVKKGDFSVMEYIARVKRLRDVLLVSGHGVSKTEKIQVVLAGLSVEFKSVMANVTFSPVPLSMERVEEALLECETRQAVLWWMCRSKRIWFRGRWWCQILKIQECLLRVVVARLCMAEVGARGGEFSAKFVVGRGILHNVIFIVMHI